MSRSLPLLLAVSLALAGCDLVTKQDLQYDDSRNSFYKQAQQDLDANDPAKAAEDYESALGANPKLLEARYQLGHIYSEKLNDPVGAIFYYQQYLKLAPSSDKASEVKTLIDKESQAFAATLTPGAGGGDDAAKLQGDNTSLKKQLADASATIKELQGKLGKHHHDVAATPPPSSPIPPTDATATPAAPAVAAATDTPAPVAPAPAPLVADNAAAPVVPAPATTTTAPTAPTNATPQASDTNFLARATAPPPPEPVAGSVPGAGGSAPARSYTVVKGDSYWKIAKKMYPHDTKNGVEKIEDANKDTVKKPLKIGQVLVIP